MRAVARPAASSRPPDPCSAALDISAAQCAGMHGSRGSRPGRRGGGCGPDRAIRAYVAGNYSPLLQTEETLRCPRDEHRRPELPLSQPPDRQLSERIETGAARTRERKPTTRSVPATIAATVSPDRESTTVTTVRATTSIAVARAARSFTAGGNHHRVLGPVGGTSDRTGPPNTMVPLTPATNPGEMCPARPTSCGPASLSPVLRYGPASPRSRRIRGDGVPGSVGSRVPGNRW